MTALGGAGSREGSEGFYRKGPATLHPHFGVRGSGKAPKDSTGRGPRPCIHISGCGVTGRIRRILPEGARYPARSSRNRRQPVAVLVRLAGDAVEECFLQLL